MIDWWNIGIITIFELYLSVTFLIPICFFRWLDYQQKSKGLGFFFVMQWSLMHVILRFILELEFYNLEFVWLSFFLYWGSVGIFFFIRHIVYMARLRHQLKEIEGIEFITAEYVLDTEEYS